MAEAAGPHPAEPSGREGAAVGRMRTSAMTFTYTITFTLDAAALPPVTGSEEQRTY